MHETSNFCDQTCLKRRRRKRDVIDDDVTDRVARYKRDVQNGAGLAIVQEVEGPFIILHDTTNEGFIHNGMFYSSVRKSSDINIYASSTKLQLRKFFNSPMVVLGP